MNRDIAMGWQAWHGNGRRRDMRWRSCNEWAEVACSRVSTRLNRGGGCEKQAQGGGGGDEEKE